jgi:hypothetical protein
MNEYIDKMIEKAMKKINGKTMYDGEIIQKLNTMGVKFQFTNEGVHWSL